MNKLKTHSPYISISILIALVLLILLTATLSIHYTNSQKKILSEISINEYIVKNSEIIKRDDGIICLIDKHGNKGYMSCDWSKYNALKPMGKS